MLLQVKALQSFEILIIYEAVQMKIYFVEV